MVRLDQHNQGTQPAAVRAADSAPALHKTPYGDKGWDTRLHIAALSLNPDPEFKAVYWPESGATSKRDEAAK